MESSSIIIIFFLYEKNGWQDYLNVIFLTKKANLANSDDLSYFIYSPSFWL